MEEKEEKFPAQWALDILEPTPVDQSNSILKYYTVPPAIISGPLGVIAYNYSTAKPLYFNKLYMVISAIGLGVGAYWIQWTAELQFARKHAIMRDYIIRHPERFPEPENRKYADILRPWCPIR
ncbi:hypothetical protein WN51_11716 [Melipona quadrifasciata]|uniref:NADH dehydrogenase [ubiquinone] 1 subunit C2 n=1 Tax=Melipona quadrifasciata TaxID=166423 RepID=A0A0M9A3B3_9HYME|nr:hypothetical protein WN51_11716 [Melipona quadrifasciata]